MLKEVSTECIGCSLRRRRTNDKFWSHIANGPSSLASSDCEIDSLLCTTGILVHSDGFVDGTIDTISLGAVVACKWKFNLKLIHFASVMRAMASE